MHYLISVLDTEAGPATASEMAAIDAFDARMRAEGRWVFAGGLGAPSTATVIDDRAGAGLVTDGPFAESKEYTAGFWIIDAPDRDAALELATEGSRCCNRRVELRPFL